MQNYSPSEKLRLRREALLTKSHAERLLLQYQFQTEFESRKRNLDASLLGIRMLRLAGQKIFRNPLISLSIGAGLLILKPAGLIEKLKHPKNLWQTWLNFSEIYQLVEQTRQAQKTAENRPNSSEA